MKIKSLLLALFIGLTTVGFAQEKKTLDNLANDRNKAELKFETDEKTKKLINIQVYQKI